MEYHHELKIFPLGDNLDDAIQNLYNAAREYSECVYDYKQCRDYENYKIVCAAYDEVKRHVDNVFTVHVIAYNVDYII